MNENENSQDELDEIFEVFLIDDMAEDYANEMQHYFKNVAIYDANTFIYSFHINESDNGQPFCLMFDATYFSYNINDYVLAYAERMIRQYPFMKNHIMILLGDDTYMEHKGKALRGSVESKKFLYRIQQLPYTTYTNKIDTIHDEISKFAEKLHFEIQDNLIQLKNLPEEYQNEINSLYTHLLNIINYQNYGVDIGKLTQQIQIVSNPERKNSLIETLKEYRLLNYDATHILSQHLSSMLYNAKKTSAKINDFNVKRLTDIQGVLQNNSERSKMLLKTLNGPIVNLENLFKSSNKIIPLSFIEFIQNIKISLIQIEDKYNQLVCIIRLVLATERIDPKKLPIISESGEDE